MPTKSMLLHFLAALYIFGTAAGDLGFDETPFNPWRAALQLDNRRAQVCDNPTWVSCPDGHGCCEAVSQCSYLNGLPVCNIPCSSGSIKCPDGNCCLAGYVCSGTQCVSSTTHANLPPSKTSTRVQTKTTGSAAKKTRVTTGAAKTSDTSETPIATSDASTLNLTTSATPTTPPGATSSLSSTSTTPLKTGTGSIALITMSSVISFAVIAVFGIFHFS